MKKIIITAVMLISGIYAMAQDGNIIRLTDIEQTGIEMQKTLSTDGSEIVERPYKWYSGIAQADDRQMALEIANREAYATISRIVENIVNDNCERAGLAVNGKVEKAVKSYWKQMSQSILKGCTPFGKATVDFNTKTKMYMVTAKVAIRGDRFQKLMGEAQEEKPIGLNQSELNEFIEINQAIIDAAKSE